MFRAGEITEPPVIDDLIDYGAAARDFTALAQRFAEANEPFPFSVHLERAISISEAAERGDIRTVEYVVGSGAPPTELADAAIVINIAGPGLRSKDEQLAMLAPGGMLFFSHTALLSGFEVPQGFEVVGDPETIEPVTIRRLV